MMNFFSNTLYRLDSIIPTVKSKSQWSQVSNEDKNEQNQP